MKYDDSERARSIPRIHAEQFWFGLHEMTKITFPCDFFYSVVPLDSMDIYADMTIADVAVLGADPVIPATRDRSGAGFCTAMSSRVVSNAGSIPLCNATSRRLRIKRVPCVLITISVGSAPQHGEAR